MKSPYSNEAEAPGTCAAEALTLEDTAPVLYEAEAVHRAHALHRLQHHHYCFSILESSSIPNLPPSTISHPSIPSHLPCYQSNATATTKMPPVKRHPLVSVALLWFRTIHPIHVFSVSLFIMAKSGNNQVCSQRKK